VRGSPPSGRQRVDPDGVARAGVGGGGVTGMAIRPMTAHEHDLQRDLVAASLLIVGENPRPLRELAIDPGTYTPSAVVRRHVGMLNPGALLDHARVSSDRTPDARSSR
jgi:hypothetical protein